MKAKLDNSQTRNWKNKPIIQTYLKEQYYGIKRTNLCRSEFSQWKNRFSPKNLNRNSKPGWEIQLEMQISNLRQQTKNDKTEEKHQEPVGTKRKKKRK